MSKKKEKTPKKTGKEVQKVLTPEEAKEFVFNRCIPGKHPEGILRKMGKELIPKYKNSTDKEQKEITKQIIEDSETILRTYENESRYALMEAMDENYREVTRELSKQIQKEYNCTTSLEKSIVGTIINAYIRVLDNSKRLNNELNGRNITHERNKYISNLSVQVDRANRQFIQSILTLKQLKTPTLGVSIKTKSAYISQNQQINNNKENNETK